MVTVLMPGQSDETACVRISAALSEVTKQKLGFSVSIEQVAPTNYSAELWKRMVCQTMPDLFFLTENQPLDVYLNQNCILPLSALLEEYPGLKALFSEQQWASRTYYRRIYAVPARAVSMYQIGFLARADWMRELDARPEEITDLDALHDLLMQVRQRRPNAEGVLPDNGQVFPFPELDPLGDTFGILTEESGTTVVNWYAADAYSRLCRTMHQWYQEGLILRNASLRDEPATDRMRLGNSFGFFARLNRDSLDCYTRACGTELTAIPLGPTIQNSSIPVESWCLPVTNSHRREALALLELLYTDASCYDLLANGDGKEEQLHPWQNLYLNASGLMPETDEQPQWVSPAYGFSFNNSAVAAKLMEVFPDGRAYNIRGGITTIAADLPEGQTYTPGQTAKVCVEMWDMNWTVQPGSCLRLDVSSSDFPQYAVHSNYAGVWSEQGKTRIAHQKILLGEGSFVELPLHEN